MDWLKGTVTPKDWLAVAIMIGVTAALCIVYAVFVRSGQIERLAAVQLENQQVMRDIQEAQAKAAAFEDLQRDTDKLQELVEVFNNRLPTERELPLLISQFESLANVHNLPHRLTPLTAIRDANKETIPYQITTYGTFHQTVSFINSLERFERYFKISGIEFKEDKQGIQETTFELKTFRFIETDDQASGPVSG